MVLTRDRLDYTGVWRACVPQQQIESKQELFVMKYLVHYTRVSRLCVCSIPNAEIDRAIPPAFAPALVFRHPSLWAWTRSC